MAVKARRLRPRHVDMGSVGSVHLSMWAHEEREGTASTADRKQAYEKCLILAAHREPLNPAFYFKQNLAKGLGTFESPGFNIKQTGVTKALHLIISLGFGGNFILVLEKLFLGALLSTRFPRLKSIWQLFVGMSWKPILLESKQYWYCNCCYRDITIRV